MRIEEKLGKFVKLHETIVVVEDNKLVYHIKAGVTVVHGPWRLVTKIQEARVIGVVTESMLNATNDKNERVYEFQGNGWKPKAKLGDFLLQDVGNPADRWACGADLFGGTGWNGQVQGDGSVIYAKPGKPLLALPISSDMFVETREGLCLVEEGSLLSVTDADKGDFYVWPPEVVAKYIREYQS